MGWCTAMVMLRAVVIGLGDVMKPVTMTCA
jgi:hypothetical protein